MKARKESKLTEEKIGRSKRYIAGSRKTKRRRMGGWIVASLSN